MEQSQLSLTACRGLVGTGLTALVGIAVLGCAFIQGLLLSVVVFISFPVPAWAGADPTLE